MIKPRLEDMAFDWNGDGVYWANRNTPKAPQRLYLIAGTHGQEFAPVIALHKLLQEDWRWENVHLTAIAQDSIAYAEEGYGFLDTQGKSSCWPPLFRYAMDDEAFWFFTDANSSWGNTVAVPPAHQVMRDLMERCNPSFCLALHETVRSEVKRDPFWQGAGLLLIETWPISPEELSAVLEPEGDPLADPLRWLGRTLWNWIAPHSIGEHYVQPKWKMAARALKDNPHYALTTKISQAYQAAGGEVTGPKWMRYQEYLDAAVVGPGRLIHTPEFIVSDWRTVTDYCVGMFGAPGITTETFSVGEVGLRGIDDRILSQYRFIVATLDTLNERGE